MNVTLSVEDELVRKVRKIAVERDTTLTGLTHDFLEDLAAEDMAAGRKRRERAALDQSFERFAFKVGKRTSKRADLYIGLLTSWTPTFSSTTMIRRIGPYLLLRIIALTPHTASTLPKGSIGTVTGGVFPFCAARGNGKAVLFCP